MISLYAANETVFTSNGLVVLSDCISFYTTEKNNDSYEVEFVYPLDKRGKWLYIVEGNIVKNSSGQLFRIYRKIKTISGIKANARHIFYDLAQNFLEDVRPTNLSGAGTLDWVLTHTQYPHNFTSISDVGGSMTRYFQKMNPVGAILGQDGIIANVGGEIERDNFTIKLLQARGLDRGVLVSYGKNIIGIEETIDLDGVITRIYPTGKDGIIIAEKYVDSPLINSYPHPMVKEVQFSDIDNETDLRTAAQNYFAISKCDIPLASYVVDFIELSKTEEYKNYAVLERIYMCDTATIRHSRLSMDLKCKAISIKFNDLTRRIEKIELGSFKPNLAVGINNAIQAVKQEIVNSKSFLQLAIENATTLLTTALGGFVVKRDGELLIMDTEDPMTATKVWRWNVNGLGYSSTGINGPYGLAMTMDGHIVANFVNTGVLNAGIIKAGILKSFNNLSWINMDTGTFDLAGKVTFDGTTFAIEASAIKLAIGKIGGVNLVDNSAGKLGTVRWENASDSFDVLASTATSENYTSNPIFRLGNSLTTGKYVFNWNIPLKASTKYTISGLVYAGDANKGIDIYVIGQKVLGTTAYDYTHWVYTSGVWTYGIYKKFTATFTTSADEIQCFLRATHKGSNVAGLTWVYFTDLKLEEGDNATAWSPATIDSPDNSNIISAINLSPESITIDAEKIAISGDTIDLSANTSVKVSAGVNSAYVDITATGMTVTNGKLTVTNPAGTVVIDGSSNMYKITATGTVTLTVVDTVTVVGSNHMHNYNGQASFSHNLGFKPAFDSYELAADGSYMSTLDNYSTVLMTNAQMTFKYSDIWYTDTATPYASFTRTYRYFIFKEAAF